MISENIPEEWREKDMDIIHAIMKVEKDLMNFNKTKGRKNV